MGHTSATRTPSWRILMASSSWHTAWGCISVSCWHLISLTAKMFYVLAKHLGPKEKERVLCASRQFSSCCCFAFRFSSSCSCVHFPLFFLCSSPLFFFFYFLGEWKWKTATNICTKRKMLLAYRCKFYMHTLHLCRECVEICYFKCWRPKGCTPGWILLAGSGGAKGSSVARWEVWQSGPRAAKVLQNHSTKEFNQQCLAGRQPYQHTHTHARTQPHQSAVKLRLTGEA